MGEFAWSIATMAVGVAFALQWGKVRTAKLANEALKLDIKKIEALRAQEVESRRTQDAEVERGARQLELAVLDTPEGRELKASEVLLKAAQNKRAAAEEEAGIEFAHDVAKAAAENEKIADRARMEALVRQADIWAKEHPPQDPVRSMNLTEAYKQYCEECRLLEYQPKTLGDWLGANYTQYMRPPVEAQAAPPAHKTTSDA